jgi:hypothetical protein
VQRALLGIMLADAAALRDGRFVLTIQRHGEMGEITIELEGATSLPAVDEIFEPFPASGRGHGLALATAARLTRTSVVRFERRSSRAGSVMSSTCRCRSRR